MAYVGMNKYYTCIQSRSAEDVQYTRGPGALTLPDETYKHTFMDNINVHLGVNVFGTLET